MKEKSTKDLPKAIRVMLIDWNILNNNSLRLYFEKVPVDANRIDAYGFVEVILSPIFKEYQFLDSFLNDDKVFIEQKGNCFNLINGEFETGYDWEETYFIYFEEIAVTTSDMNKTQWDELQYQNLSDILKRYSVTFQTIDYLDDAPTFSSPILHLASLFNANNTSRMAGRLYQTIHEISRQAIKEIDLISNEETGSIEVYPHLANGQTESMPGALYIIRTQDLRAISSGWSQFLYKQTHRSVEVTDGQSIVRIVSDDCSNALIISKPIAVNWPDCRGSIGEYYTVSNHSDEQQKILTQRLDQLLISGSNKEILDQVSIFLNLFSNGNYDISIGRITHKDYSIYHDKSTEYSKDVAPEERFTCSFYLFDNNKVLFSRSYESIDLSRVAYYVELLKQGARPKIMVYTHYLHIDHFDCPYYIIDGHHKALAYSQLGIDICTVFIAKDDRYGTFDNDMISTAQAVLKPNEFKHYLTNSSSENVNAFMQPSVTVALDDFLKKEKNIDISITEMIHKAYHSKDDSQREWIEKRLVALRENKYKGKGQSLNYTARKPGEKYGTWLRLPVNTDADFETWKNVYLEGQPLPPHLQPPPVLPRTSQYVAPDYPMQYYDADGLTAREILLIFLIILGLLGFIFK